MAEKIKGAKNREKDKKAPAFGGSLRNSDDPLNAVYESNDYKVRCKKEVLEAPIIIDIELSGFCNLHCIMCARENKVDRVMKNMDPELFFKIVDQAVECGVKLIRFSGYGEALMNKHFLTCLKYAKKKGLLTHLTSNGHLLTEPMCHELVTGILDKVKFSFQGTDEAEYGRMRKTDGYQKLVTNIKMLKRIRDQKNVRFPVIQVATTVIDETEEQIQEFYDTWKNIADNIYHLPTVVWTREDTEWGKKEGHKIKAQILNSRCMEVRTKMSIWNDGKVTACCGDHGHQNLLGDTKVNTLKEIWHGYEAVKLRNLLNKKPPALFNEHDKKEHPLCAGCTSMYIEKVDES